MGLIQKTDNSPRLYKRGNDEVDLNEYINLAERNFDSWLDSVDLKDKDKTAVRTAYSDLITKINNDPTNFTANLGGGFTNTYGITNATSGTDAYGIAAGYLGKALRQMQAYHKPVEQSTRIKYSKNNPLISSELQTQIIGNDPTAFLELDAINADTNSRSTTNRDNLIIQKLKDLQNHIDDNYDYDNESDKQDIYNSLQNAINALTDGKGNNDRYTLSQLGFTNLDDYYNTKGEDISDNVSSADISSENTDNVQQEPPKKDDTAQKLAEFIRSKYPQTVETLHGDVSLNETTVPYYNLKHAIQTTLDSYNTDYLKKWLQEYIANIDNYNVTSSNYAIPIKDPKGRHYDHIKTGYVIPEILRRLQSKGALTETSKGSNQFIVPLSRYKNGDAVWVWNSKTNTLSQKRIHSLPVYRNKIWKEYQAGGVDSDVISNYSEYLKRGGIVKAQTGIDTSTLKDGEFTNYMDAAQWLDEDLTSDKRLRNQFANGSFTLTPRGNGQLPLSQLENYYKPEIEGTKLEQQPYYQDWLKVLTSNKRVAEHWANQYKNLHPEQSIHWSNWFNSDGSFNFDNFRTPIAYNKGKGKNLHVYDDKLNGDGHDILRGRTYQIDGQSTYLNHILEGYSVSTDQPTLSDNQLVYIYKLFKNPDKTLAPIEDKKKDKLEEVGTEPKTDKTPITDIIGKYLPEGLSSARLWYSLRTNDRIAKLIKDAMRPKLHDTYELYSPVTGAFSEMQLRNQQAASAMSQTAKPFTSDASLASARMLEGKEYADQLQAQGFLADDNEIKRTAKEALLRVEDNIKRRSTVANSNRDNIIDYNIQKAQVEAAKQSKNWAGINTYLKENEARIRTNQATEQTRQKDFELKQASYINTQNYNNALKSIKEAYYAWKALPGNSGKTLAEYDLANNQAYTKAYQKASDEYTRAQLQSYAKIYGLSNNITTPFQFKKQGGTLRFNKK